jgi:hypothetical protein
MNVNSQCGEKSHVSGTISRRKQPLPLAVLLFICCQYTLARAQSETAPAAAPTTTSQRVQELTEAVNQAQTQMKVYQKQLIDLQQQLDVLRLQMAAEETSAPPKTQPAIASDGAPGAATGIPASLDEIRERQAIEESQIATHEVTKVETESKYPLKVSGLFLFSGFVNTRAVDITAAPAYAVSGTGSTGFSLRQTVLGLDARGPHLAGASSHADLRVDFFANGQQSNYATGGLLRLRTAHAELNWQNTDAFFQLDRTILEPNEPSSLVAIAQPELAWAGNLWSWNPQIGVTHRFTISDSSRFDAEAALIDPADPLPPGSTATPPAVTQSERSRWPGTEERIAFLHGDPGTGLEIGAGGYFSPHRTGNGDQYDAWAGTMDLRLPLSRIFELTANAYRGASLAGLGGGGYTNYYYYYEGATELARALDDVGGWTQLTAKAGQWVEMNAGFGTDNPFAKEIHQAMYSSSSTYLGLARNRSVYSNVIFSPSAYLLFSLEYRRLWTDLSSGPTDYSDVIGIAAGYKF